jgi:hypothetical protein
MVGAGGHARVLHDVLVRGDNGAPDLRVHHGRMDSAQPFLVRDYLR